MRRTHPTPRRFVPSRVLPALAVALTLLAACGRSGGDREAEARASIVRQLELTPTQATCLWSYLDRVLSPADFERIADHGLAAGSGIELGYYTRAVMTCVLYRDLIGGDRDPTATGG